MMIKLFETPVYKKTLSCDLKSITDYCYSLKNSTEGRQVSNRNGWQSNNLVGSILPLNAIFIEIVKAMDEYKESISAIGTVELDNIWINVNPKGGSNIPHIHPNCFMSGVYYVQTPENCGNLYFENILPVNYNWHPKHFKDFTHNTFAGDNWEFVPQANDLYVFPSWAKHGVNGNVSDTDRISISFNGQLT